MEITFIFKEEGPTLEDIIIKYLLETTLLTDNSYL